MIIINPDIHGRTFWKKSIQTDTLHESEKIIFLGDYLDPYGYENISRKEAIENFREIIDFKKEYEDKVVLLLGNHDLPYIFKEFDTKCRFDSSNAYTIGKLFHENYKLFNLVFSCNENGVEYLFSHAGLMNSWQQRHKSILPSCSVEDINNLLNSREGIRCLCDVSFLRGGSDVTGSIVWSDVNEKLYDKNDATVERYGYQIFGHSQQESYPIIQDNWACLDCRQTFILDDKKISAL